MEKQSNFPSVSTISEYASAAYRILKILANEVRLFILCQLGQGDRNVGELKQLLGIQQPTLTQQLTVLRTAGLVTAQRK